MVVPEDGYWVNGKCIDVCREDAIVIDHNPYHDKKGRFTTKTGSGSGMTAGNVNQVIELIKNKKVPLFGVPRVVKEMGISRASLYNKLKDPNRFTLGELRKLSVILHWTDEETGNII